eukprot:GFUD01020590.1.p2 GENE.GFUD01020590.1~~GFUD01020590.1.p2  ORF type:complete len:132 (+),score=15.18 GFUD01020590.1:157-552(+)
MEDQRLEMYAARNSAQTGGPSGTTRGSWSCRRAARCPPPCAKISLGETTQPSDLHLPGVPGPITEDSFNLQTKVKTGLKSLMSLLAIMIASRVFLRFLSECSKQDIGSLLTTATKDTVTNAMSGKGGKITG